MKQPQTESSSSLSFEDISNCSPQESGSKEFEKEETPDELFVLTVMNLVLKLSCLGSSLRDEALLDKPDKQKADELGQEMASSVYSNNNKKKFSYNFLFLFQKKIYRKYLENKVKLWI